MNISIKEVIRKSFRMHPLYRRTLRSIKSNEPVKLEQVVRSAISNVPFYNSYDKYLQDKFDITKMPIIRKRDIMGHESEIVHRNVSKKKLSSVETGGSTGCSLTLFRHWKDELKKTVFGDLALSHVGGNLVFGVLRGNKPKNGICEMVLKDKILFSSYKLCQDNLDEYLHAMRKYKISCLQAYPSSLIILCRLIKKIYGTADLPELKGVFTSSEIFSKEDKQLVREVFPNITIVDYYGHNEMACCAYSVNDGFYQFIPQFGFVEFVETGETINGNMIAEVVATSVMNTTMPFIRYATDDYVELDKDGNVISIIGRTSDFLVTKSGELTPCIISTRTESLQNVTNFQFFQEEPGRMIFRIAVDGFNERNRQSLLEDLNNSFGGTIDCSIKEVQMIERTKTGKQKRLVQKLDIRSYM